MGKSIRSKSRKASRSEFRNTIGAAAAEKFSAQVQANISKKLEGGASSLSALSSMLGSNNEVEDMADGDTASTPNPMAGVKVAKKKTVVRASKKHSKVAPAGQPGAHRARVQVSKSNKRGKTKFGFSTKKKIATKKRGSKKAAY
ncbi:hypothetical protein TrVE_jg2823 [Triparma verrucosa]|uniref:Uncharacterized protein n=1 Tax=Triparma verrucosa TaxID=1606542 RepID=A0A9W7BHH0_9STRA|nr:hypothetical protein TrVE_jg2823 [Triparma verrucosa]